MALVCYADDTPLQGVCDRSSVRYTTTKPVNDASGLVHWVDAMRFFHSHYDVNSSKLAPPPLVNASRSVVSVMLIFLLWGFHKSTAQTVGTDAKTPQNKLRFRVGVSFTAPRLTVDFSFSAENHSASHDGVKILTDFH